jgi:hypothetical protein
MNKILIISHLVFTNITTSCIIWVCFHRYKPIYSKNNKYIVFTCQLMISNKNLFYCHSYTFLSRNNNIYKMQCTLKKKNIICSNLNLILLKVFFYVDLHGIYCDETNLFFNSTKELSKLQ